MAQLGIDVTNVEASVPREAMPVQGWLKCAITDSEVKPSATDPEYGRRLNLTFKVLEGEFANNVFFGGLNIVNKSPVAQEIAMKDLSAIGHAVGVLVIQDSQQLHNIPMWVKVKYVPADGKYDAKNEPTGYKNQGEKVEPATRINTNSAPGVAPSAAAAPFTPPAAFVPPAAAPAVSAAPAWQAPAAAQPWTAPVAAQPVQAAPLQAPQQAALQAPAAVQSAAPVFTQPVQAAQPVAAVQAAQQVAIDPTTGLAIPPWQQQPVVAA